MSTCDVLSNPSFDLFDRFLDSPLQPSPKRVNPNTYDDLEVNRSIFEELLNTYPTTTLSTPVHTSPQESKTCSHINIVEEETCIICIDCGIEFTDKSIFKNKTNVKHNIDPSRCQIRRQDDKSIHKDVENMGFSNEIVTIANDLYYKVTNNKIYRGNSRKAIIFACIFQAYKIEGRPQSLDNLCNVFSIEKKIALKGFKYINLYAPKDATFRNKYITTINIIDDLLSKFDTDPSQRKAIIDLYYKVKNRSSALNSSKPQSIAASVIWTYCIQHNRKIDIAEFTKKVNLSEPTILRISKEILKILGQPDVQKADIRGDASSPVRV